MVLGVYHNPNLPYGVYLDASQRYTMGTMLTQVQGGVKQAVSTFSRKFNEAWLKYLVREQELFAAYEACKHFYAIIY